MSELWAVSVCLFQFAQETNNHRVRTKNLAKSCIGISYWNLSRSVFRKSTVRVGYGDKLVVDGAKNDLLPKKTGKNLKKNFGLPKRRIGEVKKIDN
jgi:hypothetical protein